VITKRKSERMRKFAVYEIDRFKAKKIAVNNGLKISRFTFSIEMWEVLHIGKQRILININQPFEIVNN